LRVVDRGVKVGVVAHLHRQPHLHLALRQQASTERALYQKVGVITEQAMQAVAQRPPGRLAHGHEAIERGLRGGHAGLLGQAVEQAERGQLRQVQHLVANGHTAACGLKARACEARKHAMRQVLQGKVAARRLGRGHPAARLGRVREVQLNGGAHALLVIKASSKIATARVQPAEAPRILCGKHEM
jgi:hypothetical protein